MLDCLIVGGGPAGLTAALYLVRFGLTAAVVDAGGGRASMIPRTRNQSLFPEGLPGPEMLDRMRRSLSPYGLQVEQARVTGLARTADGFEAEINGRIVAAQTVLLATGVRDRRPKMAPDLHDAALARGLIRYCPICDGREVRNSDVAVIATGEHGAREALFLRSYTERVTLIAPDGPHRLSDEHREHLLRDQIKIVDGPITGFEIAGDRLRVAGAAGTLAIQAVYPALGLDAGSELAGSLGVKLAEDGCIEVDDHQRTNVPGLYAAGDVVMGLAQIARALSDAAIATTTIRNDLCKAGHAGLFSL